MKKPSRQLLHQHERSIDALRDLIPPDCPLAVRPFSDHIAGHRFQVAHRITGLVLMSARYQVAHAYICGFVAGWKGQAI